jgi:hypothetical protein
MAGNGQQFKAGANINPSVFVKLSADNKVITAGATDEAIGVMHESLWDAPIPGNTNTYAVPSGQSKRVYQATESCEVIAGANLTAGQLVAPDSNGHGIVAAVGSGLAYAGVCTQGADAGGRAKILVTIGIA